MMFWLLGRRRALSREERKAAMDHGWNLCLDAVRAFLSEHGWVVEDGEIFCDGCGVMLRDRLAKMKRPGGEIT